MTREAFLLDMLEYYCVNPVERRCASRGTCKYSPKSLQLTTSEGCAIGRKLDPDIAFKIDEDQWDINVSSLIREAHYKLPAYMNLENKGFFESCQYLHDMRDFWDSRGLSNRGKIQVESMILDNALDITKFEKFL